MAAKTASSGQSAARVRQYFTKAPPFARPICKKLRQAILKAEPTIQEGWKWSVPVYEKEGLVCSIGAFKQHVGLWFFQGASMKDPKRLFVSEPVAAKRMRKIHFTDAGEVNARAIADYVKEAASINVTGTKSKEPVLRLPGDLRLALERDAKARSFFAKLSYTNRKEYIRWIETAKKLETRSARLEQAVGMLAKGRKNP